MSTRKTVLHVTEALGGGVTTAILEYARNAPQVEHHLLATPRESVKVVINEDLPFRQILPMPRGLVPSIRAIRTVFNRLRPDWIHLHSSFAGAYGRLAGLPPSRLIYTPHCFAFERQDVAWWKRASFFAVENLLSLNGRTIAGVSEREVDLGRKMLGTKAAVYLPNFADVPGDLVRKEPPAEAPTRLKVAMVGRLQPQKDPQFFLAVWEKVRRQTDRCEFWWLGGGEPEVEAQMSAAGVHVTGWIAHADLIAALARMDVYMHTAGWEGNPISLLEATALNLPIVARAIPALRSLGISDLCDTPHDLAVRVLSLLQPGALSEAFRNTATLSATFTRQAQAEALARLYAE